MHTEPPTPTGCQTLRPTDPPFLVAILVGAIKSGDKMTAALAREWLAEAGIKIHIAKDSPAIREGRNRD